MAISQSTRDAQPDVHDSDIEQSVYESVYYEIEDVESAYSTVQQQVESEEPGYLQPVNRTAQQQVEEPYLQPVNNDHIQVSYQHAADNISTGQQQSRRKTHHVG
jgi:hypothetical protein